MSSVISTTLTLALIPAILTACKNPFAHEDVGWLRATIQEPTDTQFVGAGWFKEQDATRPTDPIRLPVRFTILARAPGDSIDQQLQIHRSGAGKFAEGTYPIRPLEDVDGVPYGLAAFYGRNLEGRSESFTAQSGQLTITKSSGSRVEGTFRFTGVMYCVIFTDTEGSWCNGQNTIDPSAPRIEVTGSFSVVPQKAGTDVEDVEILPAMGK